MKYDRKFLKRPINQRLSPFKKEHKIFVGDDFKRIKDEIKWIVFVVILLVFLVFVINQSLNRMIP